MIQLMKEDGKHLPGLHGWSIFYMSIDSHPVHSGYSMGISPTQSSVQDILFIASLLYITIYFCSRVREILGNQELRLWIISIWLAAR